MDPAETIYVLRIIATAGAKSARMLGERYDIIVLVEEVLPEAAEQAAKQFIARSSWTQPEVQQIAPLAPKLGMSPILEKAVEDARKNGLAMIVYDTPVPKH